MKTYKRLFEQICSIENLELAFKKARKHKTLKPYVMQFEKNLAENLQMLHVELIQKIYLPLPLNEFILRDPKTRRISVSDFRDRVVHHAICNILEPIFEKYFIYDSYANRKGKGNLKAIQRFDYFKRKVSCNGRQIRGLQDKNYVQGYALKADIKHYFETVSHEKLMKIISEKIADKDVMDLIRKILNNYNAKQEGKGMPLGNLTSQFFANIYLNELDQFIKHRLKAKYYLRYVDDFLIVHNSKNQLESWKTEISSFLQNELLLELHPQKSKIIPLGRGVDLLGFKCFYHFRILRKRNIRKMQRRLEMFKQLCKEDRSNTLDLLESMQGWNAYAKHANTFKIRRTITNKSIEIIKVQPPSLHH
ncbi:MAG: reverse transcriptase domain-containing protein [Candidatus Nanoarchaeia archaeon]|nr:reverse transcriptase domain-containing protein [Candidatus Nanoarchaeia archaeon]